MGTQDVVVASDEGYTLQRTTHIYNTLHLE